MDKGLISGLNLIDYRKAFDLIDHTTLLKELAIYGVSGRSLQWFDSYLKDPKQKVMIQRQLSSPQSIKASVPQGSILSPLLSILFLNDLPLEVSRSTVEIYAPINVKPPRGWGGGRAWGGDLTFFKTLQSNSLPTGKSLQSNATKFSLPAQHIAVKYPRQNPRKAQ